MRRATAATALAIGLCLSAGCGYSQQALFREDIRTVHVELFTTREFRRDLEFMLTEAVKKRIETDTPYRLASREKADTILRGQVRQVRQAAFAPDPRTRQPRDKQMTLAVRLQWKDQRSGKYLLDQDVLLQAVDYLPPGGESEAFAEQKLVDRMAARIVRKLFAAW